MAYTKAGGLLLGAWGGFKRRIHGLAGIGLGALLVMGVMNPIANGPFFAILQTVVPPQMQGRVFTTMLSITMGVSPLGLAAAGSTGQ